jgi:multiple sugar transport system substrate-binding protein
MKQNVFKVLCLLMIAGMALSACGSPATPTAAPATEAPATEAPAPAPTEPPAAVEPVKVTIFVGMGTGSDPGQADAQNALAKAFNDSHTDIQVEFLFVPNDQAKDKFATMIASDQAPDIVMPMGIAGMNTYINDWLDLSSYIAKDNYDTSDYLGPAVDIVATEGFGTLGMPIGVYPTVLYYNVDLYDAAGLEYPPHKYGDDTWTFDKLAENAKKMTLDKNGNNADSPDFKWEDTTQWGFAGWNGQYQAAMEHFGGDPRGMSGDYKTAQFTTDGWKAGSQWYYDSIWTWHIRPNEDQNAPYGWDTFSAGKASMLMGFSWQAWAYSTWQGAFKWDVAAVPAGPTGTVVSPTNADVMAIPAKSKNPDQAWEVIKWMSQAENMDALCKVYGCIPVRKSVADGWVAARSAEYPGVDFQVFIDSIEHLDANPNVESYTPSFADVFEAVRLLDAGMQLGEVKNVEDSLNQLNTTVQAILDTYWASH